MTHLSFRIPSVLALAGVLSWVALAPAQPPANLKPHEKLLFDLVNEAGNKMLDLEKQVAGLRKDAAKDKDRIRLLEQRTEDVTGLKDEIKKLRARVTELSEKPPVDDTRFGKKEYEEVLGKLTDLGRRAIAINADLDDVRKPGELPSPYARWDKPAPYRRLAEPIARAAATAILKKLPDAKPRVAVFPFGDEKGEIGVELADPSVSLRGALIDELMKAANGQFTVLDREGLRNVAGAIDVGDITSFSPVATAKRLKSIKVHAAVVGTFFGEGGVSAMVAFDDETYVHIVGERPPIRGPEFGAGDSSGRFTVRLSLTDGRGGWRDLPFVTAKLESMSKYTNVLFVELPDDLKLGTRAAEFKIRVQNTGEPALFEFPVGKGLAPNPNDKDRLFGVAIRCDGVDSFYRPTPDGKYAPKVVEPDSAWKWVLSGPGKVVVPSPKGKGEFDLKDLRAVPNAKRDHSVLDVVGFQTGNEAARAFVFGHVRDSVAELAGGSDAVGLITVAFYAEKMSTDKGERFRKRATPFGPPTVGIMAGGQVPSPTFGIKVNWYEDVEETWHIFYRKKKALADLIPPKDQHRMAPVSK